VTPRSQSLGRWCVVVCARLLSWMDAVTEDVHRGSREGSLLHGCYTTAPPAADLQDRWPPARASTSKLRDDRRRHPTPRYHRKLGLLARLRGPRVQLFTPDLSGPSGRGPGTTVISIAHNRATEGPDGSGRVSGLDAGGRLLGRRPPAGHGPAAGDTRLPFPLWVAAWVSSVEE
jgi:hypothetical protein